MISPTMRRVEWDHPQGSLSYHRLQVEILGPVGNDPSLLLESQVNSCIVKYERTSTTRGVVYIALGLLSLR